MKMLATVLMSACLTVAAGTAGAQDKAKPMTMTLKECQDYTAMAKKDAMKKDAMKESTCGDMMKKADSMKKDGGMAAPAKK